MSEYLGRFRAWRDGVSALVGGVASPQPGLGGPVPATTRNPALTVAEPVAEPRVWLVLSGTGACAQGVDSQNLLPLSASTTYTAVLPAGARVGFQPLDTLQVVKDTGVWYARFFWQATKFLEITLTAGAGSAAAPGATGCGTVSATVYPDPGT